MYSLISWLLAVPGSDLAFRETFLMAEGLHSVVDVVAACQVLVTSVSSVAWAFVRGGSVLYIHFGGAYAPQQFKGTQSVRTTRSMT